MKRPFERKLNAFQALFKRYSKANRCDNSIAAVFLCSNLFEYLVAIIFYLSGVSLPLRQRKTFFVLRVRFFGLTEHKAFAKRINVAISLHNQHIEIAEQERHICTQICRWRCCVCQYLFVRYFARSAVTQELCIMEAKVTEIRRFIYRSTAQTTICKNSAPPHNRGRVFAGI